MFVLLQQIAAAQPTVVNADNYESTIELANAFAAAGSVGAVEERQRDLSTRRGKPTKPPKTPSVPPSEIREPAYADKTRENVVVTRAVKAVSIICHLTSRIPDLIAQSHLERREAWAAYWSPVFRSLSTQCVNPCREVRHNALSALQRSLLSEKLVSDDHTEWTAIFGEVLFPLILRLLKPEIYQLDLALQGLPTLPGPPGQM